MHNLSNTETEQKSRTEIYLSEVFLYKKNSTSE